MRIRDRRAEDIPEINLVPLIDVILVLIIFFVVTTTFDTRSMLKLELPRADARAADSEEPALSVLVNAEGRYFIDDREALRTDVEAIKATILEVAGDDRERPVLLRADARTPHQAVVTAMDALGQLGFRRISIATAPEAGAAAVQAPAQ
ncbi:MULTISPECIES: biopolymer transporter ExbD [unclassified Luteimonas]|uniref:ExbD/TolR family protein n=1 Tax=unclassified Luteimonas TaxID=2629088 RepID=UPI0018F08A54|nr:MULTISPECIES: biopolymer transporter ExbD [unclassified Luteimonas]MBJ6978121.1 biopolymer transporter ExbD [Luteimonas sp. MC1895]MBJ6984242.1 biopolymer transporter ExbD [Luteimonas sp. MC1750]QQO06971.1 biopolymer transporter ExbD [Luteimonas sp. MC1750]